MSENKNNQNEARDFGAELAELRAEARKAATETGADVAGLDTPSATEAADFEATGAAIIGTVEMDGPNRADVLALDADRFPAGRAFYFTHPPDGPPHLDRRATLPRLRHFISGPR